MNTQTNRYLVFGLVIVGLAILGMITYFNTRTVDKSAKDPEFQITRLGDAPVATVNGTTIFASEVRLVARSRDILQPGESLAIYDPEFQSILDELIDQRLMYLEASAQGLDQQRNARQRLNQARERIMGNILVESYLRMTVTDKAVRELYEAQIALDIPQPEVRARQIVVNDEDTAETVRERLENGDAFAMLANAYSIDRATRDQGGDMGFFNREFYDPVVTRNAFDTAVNDYVGPFRSPLGWHVMQVTDTRMSRPPSFEDMQGSIRQTLTFEAINNLVRRLRGQGSIAKLEGPSETTQSPVTEEPGASENPETQFPTDATNGSESEQE